MNFARVALRFVLRLLAGVPGLAVATDARPPAIGFAQLFEFCDSTTVADAKRAGDALDWRPLSEADVRDWRSGMLSQNGGSLDHVGWRREAKDDADLLSFWIALGHSNHRACSYSTAEAGGLLEALKSHFGSPTNFDKNEMFATATWSRGDAEISYTQIGTHGVLYVTHEF